MSIKAADIKQQLSLLCISSSRTCRSKMHATYCTLRHRTQRFQRMRMHRERLQLEFPLPLSIISRINTRNNIEDNMIAQCIKNQRQETATVLPAHGHYCNDKLRSRICLGTRRRDWLAVASILIALGVTNSNVNAEEKNKRRGQFCDEGTFRCIFVYNS